MKDKCSLTELCDKLDTNDGICLIYKMYEKGRHDGYEEAMAAAKIMKKSRNIESEAEELQKQE